MPISDIMTRQVISVTSQITVGELYPLFKKHKIHHLLVVEQGVLLGVISDRDVLKNISPFVFTAAEEKKDTFTLSRKAEKIMSRELVTVTPNTGITEACDALLKNGVSLLPVLDNDTLVGVVSWKDILRYFLR